MNNFQFPVFNFQSIFNQSIFNGNRNTDQSEELFNNPTMKLIIGNWKLQNPEDFADVTT